jgi:hypothetical protein
VTQGTTVTRDIVAKLWSLCHILRDDGVTYNEYVSELTFLLFLKMMQETEREDRIPEHRRLCRHPLTRWGGPRQGRFNFDQSAFRDQEGRGTPKPLGLLDHR